MRNGAITITQLSPLTGAADEALAVSTEAVSLAMTIPADCTHLLITVGPQPIRMRVDGQDPTASAGHYLPAGASYALTKATAKAAKFIRVSSDSDVHATPMAP